MKKLLIANRGEIAVRIIRAARALGIKTVQVYSAPDSGSLATRIADERIALGGSTAKDTYLNFDKLLNAAHISGADAVHPGYGFLSENPLFAEAVTKAGLTFVGPSSEVIALMADKDTARRQATAAGVPIVPGTDAITDMAELRRFAEEVGYPILLKAVAGGSGRGMRIVREASELEGKFKDAEGEALTAFGRKEVFAEKFLESPRHVEIQIFGDSHGNIVHLFERECSVQRRHQKLIEEAPAPNLHPAVRARLHKAALALAKAVSYVNSGTLEFLVDGGVAENSPIFFLEMNTRIQVEHPVTEVVTGVDLVQLQLRVASGEKLPFTQDEITCRGHAIEYRIYAENPAQGFTPALGTVLYLSRAGGCGVREDGWAEAGTKISPFYDALLSKVIVSGKDRAEAIAHSRAVLDEYIVEGLESTAGFHRWITRKEEFLTSSWDVYWISRNYQGETLPALTAGGPLVLPPRVNES